jgi:hypothetical protein
MLDSHPQAQDYAAVLKMDNGVLVRMYMVRVLWLFIKIGGRQCSEYIRGMLCHLNMLHHLKTVKHPIWTMWKTNVSVFNEEAGELSLSVLARLTSSTPSQSSLSQLNNKFRLIRLQLQCAQDLNVELSRHSAGNSHHHQRISPRSADCVATAVHFAQIIRQMVSNVYTPAADVPDFKDNHVVPPELVPVLGKTVQWLRHTPSAAAQIGPLSSKASTKTEGNWMANLMHAWDVDYGDVPEANASDVEINTSDSDGAESQLMASDYGMFSDDSLSDGSRSRSMSGLDAGKELLKAPKSKMHMATSSSNVSVTSASGLSAGKQKRQLKDGNSGKDKTNKNQAGKEPQAVNDRKGSKAPSQHAKKMANAKPRRKPSMRSMVESSDDDMSGAGVVGGKRRLTKPRKRSKVVGQTRKKRSLNMDEEVGSNIIAEDPVGLVGPRRGQPRIKRQKVPYDDGGGDAAFEDVYGTADEENQNLYSTQGSGSEVDLLPT